MNGFNLSNISNCCIGSAEASAIYYGSNIVWQRDPEMSEYLWFMPTTTITYLDLESIGSMSDITIEYSTDKTTWTSLTISSGGSSRLTIRTNQKYYFRGNNSAYATSTTNYFRFNCTNIMSIGGNIMSLIYGDNFVGKTTLSTSYAFACLFRDSIGLSDVSNLRLPATTLSSYCYMYMFYGCTSLTTAPKLPATTLSYACYSNMFERCTSLTTAPKLPATTLSSYCYYHMFLGCTMLTTTPELPATSLQQYCYAYMFEGCTSLTTISKPQGSQYELPATTLKTGCYMSLFAGCTSLTNVPTSMLSASTTLASQCYRNMFYGCEKLTKAPDLPATTLASQCYQHMFYGCKNLTKAPDLPATTLQQYCYAYMFQNCTSLGIIECLATNISAASCTSYWVYNVSSTGYFYKKSSMTSWSTGASGIPSGWTVINV